MNVVILQGRLAGDPESHQTANGVTVVTFRVAVDRDYTPKGGERTADFIPCAAWRQTGEFISRYFQKGRMIALEGSLQTRNYEDKQGQKRTAYEVIVGKAHFCGSDGQKQGRETLNEIERLASAAGVGSRLPESFGEAEAWDDGDLPY